jgi:hypothetical protein
VTIGEKALKDGATRLCLTAEVPDGAREVSFYPQAGGKLDPRVHFLVELHGVRAPDLAVEVLVNGWRRWAGKGGQRKPFEARLKPGQNEVIVRVGAPPEAGGPRKVKLSWWENPRPLADLYVLAVGVSRYKNHGPKHRLNLRYAAKDAEAIVKKMAAQQGLLFQRVHVVSLYDESATRENILGGLDWLASKLSGQPGDPRPLAVVALAGHGAVARYTQDFYFLPHDYNPAKSLSVSAVSGAELRSHLDSLKCTVVLLVDTCHAGALSRRPGERTRSGDPRADKEAVNKAVEKAMKNLSSAPVGVVRLFACTAEQEATEYSKLGHGLLTYAFLRALSREGESPPGAGPVIYLSEVVGNIQKELDRRKIDAGAQAPVFGTDGIPFSKVPLAIDPRWRPQ